MDLLGDTGLSAQATRNSPMNQRILADLRGRLMTCCHGVGRHHPSPNDHRRRGARDRLTTGLGLAGARGLAAPPEQGQELVGVSVRPPRPGVSRPIGT